jgi:hypothetical protein
MGHGREGEGGGKGKKGSGKEDDIWKLRAQTMSYGYGRMLEQAPEPADFAECDDISPPSHGFRNAAFRIVPY